MNYPGFHYKDLFKFRCVTWRSPILKPLLCHIFYFLVLMFLWTLLWFQVLFHWSSQIIIINIIIITVIIIIIIIIIINIVKCLKLYWLNIIKRLKKDSKKKLVKYIKIFLKKKKKTQQYSRACYTNLSKEEKKLVEYRKKRYRLIKNFFLQLVFKIMT